MDDLQARTQQELTDILSILTELTGLPSRWSGRVDLVPDADFKGKKRFICDIQVDAASAGSNQRWTTLIHEALHAISAGYARNDYQNFQGWEEGVVEQLQRLFRPRILSRLGVAIDPQIFEMLDNEHGYNKFITALETIRQAFSITSEPSEDFYLDLLYTPIKDRLHHINAYGFLLPMSERTNFFAIVSAASAVLRTQTR